MDATPGNLPPTTTKQEDIVYQGQRRINLIWESTQAVIAIAITLSVVYTEIMGVEATVLTNAFFLVVSMYLVRTNHTRTGGIGEKPDSSRGG